MGKLTPETKHALLEGADLAIEAIEEVTNTLLASPTARGKLLIALYKETLPALHAHKEAIETL